MEATPETVPLPSFDPEGFLVRPADWSPAMAPALSARVGLEWTAERARIAEAARKEFVENGVSPGLRRLSRLTGLPIKTFYDLFPNGPAKLIAKVAGIPKPKSCL